MVFVLCPEGKVSGELQLIIEITAPPIKREQGIVGRFGIGYVFAAKDGAQPGAFPLERMSQAYGIGIGDIKAVLFWFGDAQSSAVLQGKEDIRFPATEGLGDLYVGLPDVVLLSLEVRLDLQQEGAWFYERFSRVLVFKVLEIESRIMPEIVMQLKILG
jgi:hypothetical protein